MEMKILTKTYIHSNIIIAEFAFSFIFDGGIFMDFHWSTLMDEMLNFTRKQSRSSAVGFDISEKFAF